MAEAWIVLVSVLALIGSGCSFAVLGNLDPGPATACGALFNGVSFLVALVFLLVALGLF